MSAHSFTFRVEHETPAHVTMAVFANRARAGSVTLRNTDGEAAAFCARLEDRGEVAAALARMVKAHDDLSADTEGRYPPLDAGCIRCTEGTVPDRFNTGLCAYHAAKAALRVAGLEQPEPEAAFR